MKNEIPVETGDIQKVRLNGVRETRSGLLGNSPYKHAFYCGHCGKYVPFGDDIFSDRSGALRHLGCGSILRTSPHNKRGRKTLRKH
jgi:hypothetical protein